MWMICSDCKVRQQRDYRELHRAARPRCVACGGPLNRFREVIEKKTVAVPEKPAPAKKPPRRLKGGLEL
jgi:hypothetical protein